MEAPREVLAQMLNDSTSFEPQFQLVATSSSLLHEYALLPFAGELPSYRRLVGHLSTDRTLTDALLLFVGRAVVVVAVAAVAPASAPAPSVVLAHCWRRAYVRQSKHMESM